MPRDPLDPVDSPLFFGGLIDSTVPGRTDRHPLSVLPGSYVIPADVVSGWGQGNTMAGADKVQQTFRLGPYGMSLHSVPSSGHAMYARGGATGKHVKVIVAGGEFILPPHVAHDLGRGDMKHGFDTLDHMVKAARAKTVKTMAKLPGPKR